MIISSAASRALRELLPEFLCIVHANAGSIEPVIVFLLKQEALTLQAWFYVRYCLVRVRMLVAWHDASIFLILTLVALFVFGLHATRMTACMHGILHFLKMKLSRGSVC